jgi:flagellin-like hook-associated protein FlgL
MSITEIGSNQSLLHLNFATNTLNSLKQKLGTDKRINVPKEDPSGGVKVSQKVASLDDLHALNAFLNSVAMRIRVADNTMGKIETIIDRMKEELGRIIKNYPPFPPGSEERVKFLRSFKALRQEIDQLSFSTTDEAASKITADPAVASQAGDSNAVTSGNGTRLTVHSQQLHAGPTGLNIPELPETATDEEIAAAIKDVEKARKTLGQRQSGLATDALNIQQFLGSNPKIDQFAGSSVEMPKSPDLTESAAENKSSESNQTLTIDSTKSLTKDQSQLFELLK